MSLLTKTQNGEFVFTDTGEIFSPRYQNYTCREDYLRDKLIPLAPMTAKEEERQHEMDKMLDSEDYIAELKLDGTRGLMYFLRQNEQSAVRIFSRRVSEKTGWYCENTDSLPHLARMDIPELDGTIIDGEMFIPDRKFKEVASVLNCKWHKAIERQIELGEIVFHAFDIIFYKGIYIARMPLLKRKQYLDKVIHRIKMNYPNHHGEFFVKKVDYFDRKIEKPITAEVLHKFSMGDLEEAYPNLNKVIHNTTIHDFNTLLKLDKRAFYEYVVLLKGEGIMLKSKEGKYYHKRGREYTKWKKFLTREVIILGFSEPTKEYKGKFPNDRWQYWEYKNNRVKDKRVLEYSAKELMKQGYVPISKFYAENWVGNIVFGVIVTEEEKEKLLKSKKGKEFKFHERYFMYPNRTYDKQCWLLEIGECSGMTEEDRIQFSKNPDSYIGSVIEVKANEIFEDTGKMRHPRYLRNRVDKALWDCTFKNHIDC